MTIVEALKKLYVAMGGEGETDGAQSIADMLNMIADVYEGEHSDSIAEAIANIADVYEAASPAEPKLQNKTVTPTTSAQEITCGSNYDGLGTVTVKAVAATIDSNITAENIKSGVTILGVEGTYTGE